MLTRKPHAALVLLIGLLAGPPAGAATLSWAIGFPDHVPEQARLSANDHVLRVAV